MNELIVDISANSTDSGIRPEVVNINRSHDSLIETNNKCNTVANKDIEKKVDDSFDALSKAINALKLVKFSKGKKINENMIRAISSVTKEFQVFSDAIDSARNEESKENDNKVTDKEERKEAKVSIDEQDEAVVEEEQKAYYQRIKELCDRLDSAYSNGNLKNRKKIINESEIVLSNCYQYINSLESDIKNKSEDFDNIKLKTNKVIMKVKEEEIPKLENELSKLHSALNNKISEVSVYTDSLSNNPYTNLDINISKISFLLYQSQEDNPIKEITDFLKFFIETYKNEKSFIQKSVACKSMLKMDNKQLNLSENRNKLSKLLEIFENNNPKCTFLANKNQFNEVVNFFNLYTKKFLNYKKFVNVETESLKKLKDFFIEEKETRDFIQQKSDKLNESIKNIEEILEMLEYKVNRYGRAIYENKGIVNYDTTYGIFWNITHKYVTLNTEKQKEKEAAEEKKTV